LLSLRFKPLQFSKANPKEYFINGSSIVAVYWSAIHTHFLSSIRNTNFLLDSTALNLTQNQKNSLFIEFRFHLKIDRQHPQKYDSCIWSTGPS
jgi:hypothetical protein